MKYSKFTGLVTGVVTYALLVTTLGFGQGTSQSEISPPNVSAGPPARSTPFISEYVQDLSRLARSGEIEKVQGLDTDLEKVQKVLASPTRRNAVLIGEYAGTGRLIAGGLAVSLLAGSAPKNLRDKQVLLIDTASLYTAAKNGAQAEAFFIRALSGMEKADGKVILFLDDISGLAKANPRFGLIISREIRRLVTQGSIQVLTA